jgi:hypothetical protein
LGTVHQVQQPTTTQQLNSKKKKKEEEKGRTKERVCERKELTQ